MNKIERIDIYNKIEPYLSKELKRKVIEEIGINEYDIVERGSGKLKEIELEIIMLYSNKCKLIIPLEENIPNVMGGKIPDYLVVLESGEVILIEVKSTKEHKKNFTSENYINKQEEYASLLGGSLYYAINLNGFWMLFHSDYLKNKVGKITIKDVKNSKLCKVFGIKGFLVEKGFCIEQIYDKRGISDLEAYHKDFGGLKSFRLIFNNNQIREREIINITTINEENKITILALNFLLHIMSSQNIKKEDLDNYQIRVMSCLEENVLIYPIMSLIYSKNILREILNDLSLANFKKDIIEKKSYNKNLLNKLNQVFEGLISDNLPVREYKESELLIEVKE